MSSLRGLGWVRLAARVAVVAALAGAGAGRRDAGGRAGIHVAGTCEHVFLA
jgi:hypothetical protein